LFLAENRIGRGFFAVWVVVFSPFGFFACLSVWFGCMIPGLYEVIQYTLSLKFDDLQSKACILIPTTRIF